MSEVPLYPRVSSSAPVWRGAAFLAVPFMSPSCDARGQARIMKVTPGGRKGSSGDRKDPFGCDFHETR